MVGSSNSYEFRTLILHCKNSQVKDHTEKIAANPWVYCRSHHDQGQQMTCCSVFTCLLSAVYRHFPFSCGSLLLLYHSWTFAVNCLMQPKSGVDYHMLQQRISFLPLHTQLPSSLVKCPALHSTDTGNDRRLCHVCGPLGAEKRPVLSRYPIWLQHHEG